MFINPLLTNTTFILTFSLSLIKYFFLDFQSCCVVYFLTTFTCVDYQSAQRNLGYGLKLKDLFILVLLKEWYMMYFILNWENCNFGINDNIGGQ